MSTKRASLPVPNVSSLILPDDVAVTDQEPEELERSYERRRQEKKSLYQRVGKDRSNHYTGTKLPLMPPKTPSIEGPVPSIAASIAAEGNHERSVARSMERRQKELEGHRRSPPSKRAKTYVHDKDQDLIQFTPKPMPSKYSNKLLLSSSEKNSVPGTRAHQILALRRSEIAGHDAFNSGMRVSESLSELRHRLEEADEMNSLPHLSGPRSKLAHRLSSSSVSKSVPILGKHGKSSAVRKQKKPWKVKHKVHARKALTTRISPAPKTTEQIYNEYKQGKHRKVPVITPGLPYRGLRSKKKFPSGYARQKEVLERHRLYRIQQSEDETIQNYQHLAENLGLLSMSVTGHVQNDDDAWKDNLSNNGEFYSTSDHQRGNNTPNGSSILSQLGSDYDPDRKKYTNSEIPPSLPGDWQNLKQNQHPKMNKNFVKADPISGSISRESSKGGGWWKNYDDDLIFNDGMGNGSFFDSRVNQSMSSSGANGPFHFLFFDDKGKEGRSRTPYERASFCPASPHGRRVYWEESIGRTASMQMNGRAFSANHRPYSSSYVLPPNSSKWGRQNDGKVYGPDIVETVVISASSHDRLLVAPLADPRSRESMRDPSFQMSQIQKKSQDPHVMEEFTADETRYSSITPDCNFRNDAETESGSVAKHALYTKVKEEKNDKTNTKPKNAVKATAPDMSLEQFKPAQVFDHSGIGAWDARSECSDGTFSRPTSSENIRLSSMARKLGKQNRNGQNQLNKIEETVDKNVLQEFRGRTSRGTKSKFCKLKLGVDINVCLSQISGKQVTASQKNIYVPNGTLFSDILEFFVKIFALNENLVWAVEHLEPGKSVWTPIDSNSQWQSLLSMFSSAIHRSNSLVKLRVRRHAESSGLVKDEVGTLINTPGSLQNYKDGNLMQRQSIREDVPTAMLTTKKFTGVRNGSDDSGLVSLAAINNAGSGNSLTTAGKFDIDALQANIINGDNSIPEFGQPSSPVWNETKFDGWSSNPEHDATAFASSYDSSKSSSKPARAKIHIPKKIKSSIDSGGSSISEQLYQRMQGSQISPQAKKLAHYLRSKRFIESYDLYRDGAGRKPFYLPTNDPILDESYNSRGSKAGRSILEMENLAGSPFWNRRSSINRKLTKKRYPIRKLPSIKKMKQFQASILKKYSIKEQAQTTSKNIEESSKIENSVSADPESREITGARNVREFMKHELKNRLSFRTLYSKERLNRARLSMKIPRVDEPSEKSLRSARNRLFITEDDYGM